MSARSLRGRIAVVAGATRGAGRGIARMLGEAGAIVYCTGRSSRESPPAAEGRHAGRPETIEETAELVSRAGGTGIAMRVDHRDEAQIARLFDRVRREQGRLEILVNVATGDPVQDWRPFWELSLAEGRALVESWIWPHLTTNRHAIPLMVAHGSGLVVELVEQDGIPYHGQFFFDAFETLLKRTVFALAHELRPHGVSVVAIAPGFMRTEAMLAQLGVTESTWREASGHPDAARWGWERSETPCYTGRAVAALAADPAVLRRSGGIYPTGTLAREYRFTDVDGSQPDLHAWLRQQAERTAGSEGGPRWVVTASVGSRS